MPKGFKHSKETKNKIAKANKLSHGSIEYRKKMSEKTKNYIKVFGSPRLGKKHNEDAKRKIGLKSKQRTGKLSGSWKGGRIKTYDGYILIRKPNHPFSGKRGYVLEHRLVMEKELGRYLTKKEVVHHIDGNIENNSINNLELFSDFGAHVRNHYSEKKRIMFRILHKARFGRG